MFVVCVHKHSSFLFIPILAKLSVTGQCSRHIDGCSADIGGQHQSHKTELHLHKADRKGVDKKEAISELITAVSTAVWKLQEIWA